MLTESPRALFLLMNRLKRKGIDTENAQDVKTNLENVRFSERCGQLNVDSIVYQAR